MVQNDSSKKVKVSICWEDMALT